MSFSTTDNSGNQTNSYGGGKSSGQQPLYKSVTDAANQSASQMPGLQGQLASMVTKNAGNLVDAAYRGGPPQLDLSGLMPKTPAQKVAESRAGGGILKLRQPPQPFNPNPTPNPGFGGGKGLIQPIGGQPSFGGGKSMPAPIIQPGVQDPSLPPGVEFGLHYDANRVPTKTYGQ